MSTNTRSQESEHIDIISTTSYHTNYEDSETDSTSLVHVEEDVPIHIQLVAKEICSCRNKQMRTIRSKGAILVLVITCMVNVSFNGALGNILHKFIREFLKVKEIGFVIAIGITFIRSIPQLAYPFAGWVADVKFGRFKVLLATLWLMFVGHAIILVSFSIYYYYHDLELMKYITYLVAFPVAFLSINIGLAAFQANVIPFGLDQMPDGSTEELCSFIHWYYGSRNIIAGLIPLMACFFDVNISTVIVSSCEISCITFALVLCYVLKHIFIIEPQSRNPFKLLYGVLKYSFENTRPRARSSFTYWEEGIPSRIDLGKSKYGGPFSNEEVEDVKTFIRTTGVLVASSIFIIGYHTLFVSFTTIIVVSGIP